MYNINFEIIKKHLKNILIFIAGIHIAVIISVGVVFTYHIDYIDRQMNNNIAEYQEIDREQLCKISECVRVAAIDLKQCYSPDNKGHLKVAKYRENEFTQLFNSLHITDTYHLTVFNEQSRSHYALDTDKLVSSAAYITNIFMPLAIIIFIIPLYFSIRNEQEELMVVQAGSEALLANKSMISITENIHHELNTPLEVIDNKIEKIHRIIADFLTAEYNNTKHLDFVPKDRQERNKSLLKLEEDFDFIRSSSEQIYAVLEKMKGFKHLRYSNGNKSIKNIIDGGFKIINMSNTNFDFKIDKKLTKFKIKSDTFKNAEFLSIILNHIKNSLEANASKIFIIYASNTEDFLTLRIVDNGNGIPKAVQKDIFKPNFSTKSTDSGIRGNGMYLNKHILGLGKGTINLISSTNKGTTIELTIPTVEKK